MEYQSFQEVTGTGQSPVHHSFPTAARLEPVASAALETLSTVTSLSNSETCATETLNTSILQAPPIPPTTGFEVPVLSSIFRAVNTGNELMVRLLIEKGADLSRRDLDGSSLLHHAATLNDVDILTLLLKNSCDVNATDCRGQTPIFLAVSNSHIEATMILLEYGAEVGVRDSTGCVPLHLAVEKGLLQIAEILIANGADIDD
ncbi:hypothetical protein NLG97_g1293 [Lecanicillium saksenae]|uniref:Uncharacterized protein n=1 Tax=Lecanicillium saksenae TaxID=468837 RepID=A0ACC1R894_9HYPO|nr:hypothetical protein NLG97_g1293 [Lecanicillium saksenae]